MVKNKVTIKEVKMKYVKFFLVFVMAVAMLGVSQHPAAAIFYNYTSGFQVQNLSSQVIDCSVSTNTNITLDYYDQQTSSTTGGNSVTSANDCIPALGSKTYFPIQAPSGFKGSVVISSTVPMASIVNLVANGIGNASYVGMSQGSNDVALPLLMQNNSGIYTWFSVQNVSSTTSNATVSVSYSDGTADGPVTIKPNASWVFDQSSGTHQKVFAGTLHSDQPVVVVVVQEGGPNASAKTILAANGFGADTGKTIPGETNTLMPLVNANNGGFSTGIQLQNTGGSDTVLTLSYTPTTFNGKTLGTPCTETQTVKAHASATFALYPFAGVARTGITTTCTKAQFVGGAQITSNTASQPIVGIVNQTTATSAEAYDSFLPSKTTANVVMPLIMDHNSGWYTGFTVANVGADPVDVNCSFTGTTYTVSGHLNPGGVLLDIQQNKINVGSLRYVGSGTCTATGTGQTKIVAVVNEIAAGTGDTLLVYEGINQ